MAVGLTPSTLEHLKRFNRSFPQFYEQFVSNDLQLQHLQLAHRLYQTRRAVIEFTTEGGKTALNFAYRNSEMLLSDIFGVLATYRLTIHSISLYGQIQQPMLVFMKLVGSRSNKPITDKTAACYSRCLGGTLGSSRNAGSRI